jgi:hypothetical protein
MSAVLFYEKIGRHQYALCLDTFISNVFICPEVASI